MYEHHDDAFEALASRWQDAPPRSVSGDLFCPHEIRSVVGEGITDAWAVLGCGPVLLSDGTHGEELTYRVWHAGSDDVPSWVLAALLQGVDDAPD